MHIVGQDDATGYISQDRVNDALAELNKQFAAIKMQFYFKCSSFKYYNNTALNTGTLTDAEVLSFSRANSSNNSMNLFAAQTIKSGGVIVGGWSYVAPSQQMYNLTWVNNGQFNDDESTPHEIGHYFGLSHTFNNSNNSNIATRELVTRNVNEISPRISANCKSAGDYICDTPADPRGNGNSTVTNCVYTGTVTDVNGDAFNPLVDNYMDYNFCRPYTFTPEQYDRMINLGLPTILSASNFTLDAPETTQAAPSNVIASVGTYASDIVISWKDNSLVETGYIIEAKKPGGVFIPVKGVQANATTAVLTDNILAGEQYTFRVKASNSKENYSEESNLVKAPILCGNNNATSCTAYAEGNTSSAWNIESAKITNASSEVLINNSNSNCSTNGIGNFYDTKIANAKANETLTITIRSKVSNTNTGYNGYGKVYVDWNQDGVFDENAERVALGNGFSGFTQSFTIPSVIEPGSYRLRVALDAGSLSNVSPCRVSNGEIEDYQLKITSSTLASIESLKHDFKVFPNPVKDILHFTVEVGSAKIYSADGKVVLENISGKSVNISKLPKGLYIVSGIDKQGNNFNEKLTKN